MMPAAETWERLARALEYPHGAPAAIQEQYSDTFDFDPSCSLDVGWQLFGDAIERGALLATLREDLVRVGVPENGELPDYLPTLLRLLAREDDASRRRLAALISPAVAGLAERLAQRGSPFSDVMNETARMLETVPAPETLPDLWAPACTDPVGGPAGENPEEQP